MDREDSEWKLVCDAKDNPQRTGRAVQGSYYGRQRMKIVEIDDAAVQRRGERGSDIALVRVSGDAVFHLADIERI